MKKLVLLMAIIAVSLSAPILAKGADMTTLVGSIQGYDCVMTKQVCPIGKEDVMVGEEEVLVLLVDPVTADYYVMPNMNQRILARHINQDVKVVGYLDKERKSMWVEEMYSGPKKVWSTEMQSELHKQKMKNPNK
jgi:hypothetical protein